MTHRLEFATDWIQLTETDGAWSIETSLLNGDEPDEYTYAIHGFESTLLAMAPHINLNDPKVKDAVQEALDAIENRYT